MNIRVIQICLADVKWFIFMYFSVNIVRELGYYFGCIWWFFCTHFFLLWLLLLLFMSFFLSLFLLYLFVHIKWNSKLRFIAIEVKFYLFWWIHCIFRNPFINVSVQKKQCSVRCVFLLRISLANHSHCKCAITFKWDTHFNIHYEWIPVIRRRMTHNSYIF